MKSPKILLAKIIVCLVVAMLTIWPTQQNLVHTLSVPNAHAEEAATNNSSSKSIQKMHIVGGFSANTAEKIANASADGVKTVFYYGNPPTQDSAIGQQLQSLHMNMVDGFISSNLYYYECQRLRARPIRPTGLSSYCGQKVYPTFANQNVFLTTIATHLQVASKNQLIIGYWVLDDWLSADAGGAKSLLIKIHRLVQQYTPGRSAICGFGSSLWPGSNSTGGWTDNRAANFSPQGCDAVGLYIYASAQFNTRRLPSSNAYDWSMSKLLPTMFTSLKKRGWNITKEPLIGIGQAFGGPRGNTNIVQVTPTAKNIATQSLGFCKHGASGVTYYAWADSGFGPLAQTPLNNSGIAAGIKSGIAACTQYWRTHK